MHDILEAIRLNIRPRHILIAVLTLVVAGVIVPSSFTPGPEEPTLASLQPASLSSSPTPTPTPDPLTPSRYWANAYSTYSLLGAQPLPVGTTVRAYDPQGILVGKAVVTDTGAYGLMTLYGDDPATTEDEGARDGDRITFTVDNRPAIAMGPDSAIWVSNGVVLQVDLLVE